MPAAVLIAIAVAGTAVQVTGQIKAGNAAKRAGRAEADRLEWNASQRDLQAADALARGADEETRFRQTIDDLVGRQRAAFAGQNVRVDTPGDSARAVGWDTRGLGELDLRTLRANAQREAWGYANEATDLRMGASTARRTGNAMASASRWQAAGTIIGAAGNSYMLARYGWNETGGGSAGASTSGTGSSQGAR